MSSTSASQLGPARAMRVAIEGCGHGTLDAIYTSIEKSCAIKGWDTVDLVIICGDFQAVRDKRDLNVTAMPAKYRQMADFHQYYWGTKTAPYLTIFIGGNHEASNHLFELYYGGWAAPNIYYLGAANVVQVGPLKIAGVSGIWKGYDYRKPHFERLPYSDDEMYSIYHVRELDVRKLLAYRSQVDIGLSHDWPKGIEWLGDHESLFKHKPHLREDAESGKLGNTAAKKVMDWLRPRFWFAAHLHTKYLALKQHDKENEQPLSTHKKQARSPADQKRQASIQASLSQKQLSAWNTFGDSVQQQEAEDAARSEENTKARQDEAQRNGVPIAADYLLNETYRKVRLGNGFERKVTSTTNSSEDESSQEASAAVSQFDGCCQSLPCKRRRLGGSSPPCDDHRGTRYTSIANDQMDGSVLSSLTRAVTANPDAIDIDMSDDDNETTHLTSNAAAPGEQDTSCAEPSTQGRDSMDSASIPGSIITDTFTTPSDRQTVPKSTHDQIEDDPEQPSPVSNDVSEDLRAQLAALSNKFEEPIQVSPSLSRPETITNQNTRFLALSKCDDKQNFLQLIEVEPSHPNIEHTVYPVKLQYDPEWLAILRVFAPELALGGSPNDPVPQHRGDTYYHDRILEEEKWVDENITSKGLLDIPANFSISVPPYDGTAVGDSGDKPREVSNPQTSAFCKLIEIDNLFDISEEERSDRILKGATRPAEAGGRSRNDHRNSSGHGGRGRGHGHRGGSSRGGRGRGGHSGASGRGRGRW